jgi:hypothetical protein
MEISMILRFLAGREVPATPQARQIKQLWAGGGKRRRFSVAFRGNLPLTFSIMDPNGPLYHADGSYKGTAIWSHGNAFFFGGTGSNLLKSELESLMFSLTMASIEGGRKGTPSRSRLTLVGN